MKNIFKFYLILLFIFLLLHCSFKSALANPLACGSGISGVVQDSQEEPINDAQVIVMVRGEDTTHDVKTGSDGAFVYPWPINGEITISVNKAGYELLTISSLDQCSNIRLTLTSQSTPTSAPGTNPRCSTGCADSTQCSSATDRCTSCYHGTCTDPSRIPTIIPTSTAAINFNQLITAVPSLKPVFTQGASGVMPILSDVMKYLYVFAGLLLLFYLIYGGFHMMIAAKDEKGLVEAKGKITNALIGFLILFLSFWIVQIMEYVLGIQIF